MNRTIFYSWQSDSPNSTNRGFIEDCIKRAIKNLQENEIVPDGLDVDRDTLNEQGSPGIAQTILDKIDRCALFIADVSIINPSTGNGRKTPNPNVLIELGYAVRVLGWERVICICNTAYGDVNDLPFDIRHRRVVKYTLTTDDTDKSQPKNQLIKQLQSSIAGVLSGNLQLLARDLRILLDEIDPRIMLQVRHGTRKITVNVPSSHAFRLQSLRLDAALTQLAIFESNHNFIWNNPQQGPTNGWVVTFTELFANLAS